MPQRATVGGLLRLQVSAVVVVPTDVGLLGDIWLIVHLPLAATPADVPGWPGPNLPITLAAILGDGDLDYPSQLPDEHGVATGGPGERTRHRVRNVERPADL